VSVYYFSSILSSASGEGGQNNGGLVRLQGHRDILQKRGACGCEAKGQTFPAVVLVALQGKGLCGKEA